MAGMSPVTMIKEPEAAALYTMHSLEVALESATLSFSAMRAEGPLILSRMRLSNLSQSWS